MSLKLSRATLDVLEPKRGGPAAESASDDGAEGGVVALGERGSRARMTPRRAAGVSAMSGGRVSGMDFGCTRSVGNSSS